MSELAESMGTFSLHAEVRRSMQHARGFRVELHLSKVYRVKLAELDRVVAARTEKQRS